MDKRKKTNLIAVVIVIVFLLILFYVQRDKLGFLGDIFNSQSGGASILSGSQLITMDKYQSIQTGMTYEEVVKILGASGEEMSQNKIEGVPGVMASVQTIMYQWINKNGSNMNAIFQNNKLMQKAQFGLK